MGRLLGGGFLVLAGVVYWGLALPLEHQTASSLLEVQRLDRERRQVSSRLVSLERREALSRRVSAAFSPEVVGSTGTVRALRLSVIGSLKQADVSGVRLAVRAGEGRSTKVVVSAEGSFAEIVRLSGHVARPGAGLILERVGFISRPPDVTLSLEALSAAATSAGAPP
jgi:hypothetical protein